ncbi:hypothetical protein Tco_0056012, partial [Tanacetum coccineum]
VVVETVDQDEVKTDARGLIEVRVDRVTHPVIVDDVPKPAQEEGAVEVTYETLGDLRDQGHRIVVTGQQGAVLSKRIRELERNNMRLRDMMDVASQRVTRSQHRDIMPNTRSGASRTREGINEPIDGQLVGALGARTTARNLEPLMRDEGGQEEGNGNGGNGNGRNGNGNENGGGNGYNFGGFMPARECIYQDFLKC